MADRADPLGDVLGEVADALEVAGHADRADHGAQILRHRLALGDQRDRAVVELALARVHDGVVRDDALRQRIVGDQQRADCRADHRAGKIAHVADQLLDVIEIFVERGDGMFAHGSGVLVICRGTGLSRNGR